MPAGYDTDTFARSIAADAPEGLRQVTGIAGHVLSNHERTRARRARIEARLIRDERTPISDEASFVLEALETLASADQELMRLVLWDGFGIAEAGALAGVRPAAARKRYEWARMRLRAAFDALEPAVVDSA